tara:strand:+ start:319 stop:447 length:129 start_codon:yes stop_codon:yes gene_type:complete
LELDVHSEQVYYGVQYYWPWQVIGVTNKEIVVKTELARPGCK